MLLQGLGKLLLRLRELARARFELPFQLGGRFRGCVQRVLSLSFRPNEGLRVTSSAQSLVHFRPGPAKDGVANFNRTAREARCSFDHLVGAGEQRRRHGLC